MLQICLSAKPVVVFKPESAHFGDYRRCRSSHFVTGFAGIWHKHKTNQKISKTLKQIQKRPNDPKCFRAHPNVSQRIWEGPHRSKHVSGSMNTLKNLRTLREKLFEHFAKVACVPSLFLLIPKVAVIWTSDYVRCRDPEFVWIAIRLGELDQLKA